MTSGQGTEIHFNDAALNASGVRLVDPVRSDKRILKSQRDGNALAVARATQRHPVAVDFNILRPVQQNVHQAPQPNPASSCGIVHNDVPKLGSTPKVQIPWDVFAHPAFNSHASTRVIRPTRPNGHPPQQPPADPHANCCGGASLSVSRSTPNQSANGDAGALAPRHPTPASLTLQHGP